MKSCVLGLVCLVFFSFISSSAALFNIPDLAVIAPGNYHVFPAAKNKNAKFNTIQAAIDQAVCDGYVPGSGLKARITIYESEGVVYQGAGPDNEIHLPSSVSLHGAYSGSITGGPKVNATIIMDNTGSAPFQSLFDITDLIWQSSGLTIIQPTPDKPAVICHQDLAAFVYAPTFVDCTFFSEHFTATAPIMDISSFAILVVDRCWTLSASPQPFILARDAVTVDYLNSVIVAAKAVVSEGIGQVAEGTSTYFKNMDFAIELGFFGSPDHEIIMYEQLNEGIQNVLVFGSDFLLGLESNTTTGDRIIYKAAPTVQNASIIFATNVYLWSPGGADNYIYFAPNATVNSGGNVLFPGLTSATNTNLVVAPSI